MKPVVLHIAPMPPQIGGMEMFAGDLLPALSRFAHVISLDISKPLLRRQSGFPVYVGYSIFRRPWRESFCSYKYSASFLKKMISLLLYKKIDIVHIHTASYSSFWEKCIYILLARFAGKAVVLHVHGALFDRFYADSPRLVRKLIRRFVRQCRLVIVLGQKWRRFFANLLPENQIAVIENGILIPDLPKKDRCRNRLVFIHLGEISERKGVSDLLRAFAEIKELGHEFLLRLVGGGELEKAAELAHRLNLHSHVEILGPKFGKDKWSVLREADVFVLASYAEGMPIAVIEAMAAGLPIIAAKVGSIPEMLEDGRNGFLVAPGNRKELCEAIQRLLLNEELRESMALDNRMVAEKRFDIRTCAERIAEHYTNILQQ